MTPLGERVNFINMILFLKILSNKNMFVWGLVTHYRWDFLLKLFFPLFAKASRTFCQHLTCHIWKNNEIVMVA